MLVTQIALSPNKLAIPPHSSTLYADAKRPELTYQLGKKNYSIRRRDENIQICSRKGGHGIF